MAVEIATGKPSGNTTTSPHDAATSTHRPAPPARSVATEAIETRHPIRAPPTVNTKAALSNVFTVAAISTVFAATLILIWPWLIIEAADRLIGIDIDESRYRRE